MFTCIFPLIGVCDWVVLIEWVADWQPDGVNGDWVVSECEWLTTRWMLHGDWLLNQVVIYKDGCHQQSDVFLLTSLQMPACCLLALCYVWVLYVGVGDPLVIRKGFCIRILWSHPEEIMTFIYNKSLSLGISNLCGLAVWGLGRRESIFVTLHLGTPSLGCN